MGRRDDVEAIHAEYSRHFGKQDSAGVANLYTEDARYLPPGFPLVEGRDAIRAFMDGIFAWVFRSLDLQTQDLIDAGDYVIEIGSFGLGADSQDADQVQAAGKSVAIYRRGSDGSLRLAIDAFNMNAP